MPNLVNRFAQGRWNPDADPVGAPEGSLLRADNTIPDRDGVRSLRLGSSKLFEGAQYPRIEAIHTAQLDNTVWRMFAADNRVYANGVALGAEFADGDGDVVFGDDSYQVLIAKGTTKKKWDGTNFHNWSLAAPIGAPTVAAVSAITVTVASCDQAESPAFVINEGTGSFVIGHDGTATGALKLAPNVGPGRASASKKFVADQNYYDIGGAPGGSTDLFDMRIWFEDWRKVDKVTIMFGLGTGTDPYKDDYFYFDFNIRDKGTVNVKDSASAAAAAYALAGRKSLNVLSPQQVTNIRNPAAAGEILKRLGRFAGPRSTERRDAQEASPAWGHLSVTRGQFNRIGGTAGRGWATVRAFKIVYTLVPGSAESMYLDDVIWTGGGARSLTGNFTVGFRFARKFADSKSGEIYYELSPMSPISTEITLNQQTLQVTLPATVLAAADAQAEEAWVYLNGGWLDTYYRFAVLPSAPTSGMTIDEMGAPAGLDFNTPEERTRLTTWGFSVIEGGGASSNDVVFTGGISEIEILIDNEPYTPGTMPIPDNIVAIAGPWNGRMFLLDNQGFLYPTGLAPSNVSAYHVIDLRRYGTPLWLAKTSTGVVAGFSKDIIRIAGSGEESEDRVIVDLYGDPLNVANPPVDKAVLVDGNTVIYRAADGLMVLSGSSLSPLPYAGTSLLWRGESRHGVSALNPNGRYRMAVDNHILSVLMPEGANADPNAIWKYYLERKEWVRHVYPFTPLSIFREPDGRLVVGTSFGEVWEIDTGSQDGGSDIPVYTVTPFDDGGNPLVRKDFVDFQMHADTGGDTLTTYLIRGGEVAPETEVPVVCAGPNVFRADVSTLRPSARIQAIISGACSTMNLHSMNLTYNPRPQQVMSLDLGYVVPEGDGDMAWITEVEIDCSSAADLLLDIYKDDVLYAIETVPVINDINVRSSYRVPVPRGTKAKRLRLALRTTNPSGVGDRGFEVYSVKSRASSAGNATSLNYNPGDGASA